MRNSKKEELIEMLKAMVTHNGAKAVAADLDKAYTTLMQELDWVQTSAKLGLVTFIDILELLKPSQQQQVLTWLNDYFHGAPFVLIPKVAPTKEEFERMLLRAGKEYGDISSAFLDATSDNSEAGRDITPEEWRRIENEAMEAIQLLYQIKQAKTR